MTDPYEALDNTFIGSYCVECSSPPELFCFQGDYVSICSGCTARKLGAFEGRLPFDLIVLESAARRTAEQRLLREHTPLSVDLNCLAKCARCERFFEQSKARGASTGPPRGRPLCLPCWSMGAAR